jgi:hypothetical protein
MQSTEVSEVKSGVVSLPSVGSYSMRALLDGWTGVIETPDHVSSFAISSNFSFVSDAQFAWYPIATACPTCTFTAAWMIRSPYVIFEIRSFLFSMGFIPLLLS